MNFEEIDIGETHIRLTTDMDNHGLSKFIFNIRRDLKGYISRNSDFLLSIEPIKMDEDAPFIIRKMVSSSGMADVGPMACVAGTISEMSLDYLTGNGSKYSIVENGGDIALVNDERVLCGIYSNNDFLGNEIAFAIPPRKRMLGICTSSGKIGHSISFGDADSVTVISKSPSIADGLATRIANDVVGEDSESRASNGAVCAENYREFFDGVLIVSGGNVATVGRLPKIVETKEFKVRL